MLIAIGSDHGGFLLKENLKDFFKEQGVNFRDFGVFSQDSADYPDIAWQVAQAVAAGECGAGVLLCGTGAGMSIAANKVKGIRAVLCHDVFTARMSRKHNDANILTMGERVIGFGLAREIAGTWLETDFEGERHARRIEKIRHIEENRET